MIKNSRKSSSRRRKELVNVCPIRLHVHWLLHLDFVVGKRDSTVVSSSGGGGGGGGGGGDGDGSGMDGGQASISASASASAC